MAVIVDDGGRILLLDHSYRNEYSWALPSGWVRRGEQPAEAVAREIREEVSLRVKDVTLLNLWLDPSLPRADLSFVGRPAESGAEPVPSDPEIRAAGFYSLDALPAPLRRDQMNLVLEAFRRLGLGPPAGS